MKRRPHVYEKKALIVILLGLLPTFILAGSPSPDTALLPIDIQNFYFPGGKAELVNPEQASRNASKLLIFFRNRKLLVVHVRHNSEPGGEIHVSVKPQDGEKIISKNTVNGFKDSHLLDYLRSHKIKKLVICGMMTHMCVEAATRAAHDFGFTCTLVSDACATRALKFNGYEISAEAVHYSTLSSLSGYYAQVTNTEKILGNIQKNE